MSTKSHEIVVLFDTVAASRHAEKALEAAGFADPDVNTLDAAAIAKSAGAAKVGPWLWRRLFGEDVKLYEGAAFEKALAKGGAVLTVRIKGDEDAAKAEAILAKHNPVDLEARGAGIVAEHKALGDVKEHVLRLAEEQLEVGKKTVAAGKTRVRRYVTEREVQEKVNLTEVHAEVLRKAVDQPVEEWDWSDSTIEVLETREEAVVSKTAHVAEEIRLKTEETERTETVTETVRRQQAEIEHLDEDGKVIKNKK
jgi:stress response protein YsnF